MTDARPPKRLVSRTLKPDVSTIASRHFVVVENQFDGSLLSWAPG